MLYETAGMVGGANLYSYCLNNPVMLTDSTGQFFLFDWIKKGAKAVGSAFSWVGDNLAEIGMVAGSAVMILGGVLLLPTGVGAVLIGAGVGSLIGAGNAAINGNNVFAGWLGGAVQGGIAAIGVAISPAAGMLLGALGNFAGGVTTSFVAHGNLKNVDWRGLVGSSLIAGAVGGVAGYFGQATKLLSIAGYRNLYIATTIGAEFMFADLFSKLQSASRNLY